MSSDPTCLFTLSTHSFKNTLILDSSSEPLYYIETKKSFIHNEPTYIYRRGEKGAKDLIGEMHFYASKTDKIILNGEEKRLDEIVPKKGGWMGNRAMSTPSGTFTWKGASGKPKLVDDAKRILVKCECHTFSRKKPTIEIASELLPHLDLVVIGWVTMSNDIEKTSEIVAITAAAS